MVKKKQFQVRLDEDREKIFEDIKELACRLNTSASDLIVKGMIFMLDNEKSIIAIQKDVEKIIEELKRMRTLPNNINQIAKAMNKYSGGDHQTLNRFTVELSKLNRNVSSIRINIKGAIL